MLIGWSFFQNFPEFNADIEFEESGCFRKRDWVKGTENLVIIGEKQPRPSLAEIIRDTLRWLLKVTRTPMVRPEPDTPEWYRNRHSGLAAYDAWIEHLLRDAEWPAADETALRAHHQIHVDAIGVVAKARWYGSLFLAEIAEGFADGPGKPGTTEHVLHAGLLRRRTRPDVDAVESRGRHRQPRSLPCNGRSRHASGDGRDRPPSAR